jgi:hypothetical protein
MNYEHVFAANFDAKSNFRVENAGQVVFRDIQFLIFKAFRVSGFLDNLILRR